jgi:hypothetical protein
MMYIIYYRTVNKDLYIYNLSIIQIKAILKIHCTFVLDIFPLDIKYFDKNLLFCNNLNLGSIYNARIFF